MYCCLTIYVYSVRNALANVKRRFYRSPEAFLSIQLEKQGPRDVIVNAFVRKKETQGMLLKKEGEIEKLKRTLVSDFCKE